MVLKAKSPDISRYYYGGRYYEIYDAHSTYGSASKYAKDLRTLQGRIHQFHRTLAIVVDLGKGAGRLRYGIFTAKGAKI